MNLIKVPKLNSRLNSYLRKKLIVNTRSLSTQKDSKENTPLTSQQKAMLSRMLRVDHAGEIGANYIYKGQLDVLKGKDVEPVIQHMWDQEKKHLSVLDDVLVKSRVRPSLLRPVWELAGYTLGVTTAMLGPQAAMACTEAVETVIGNHYNDQIRELAKLDHPEIERLIKVLQEFRDEELEHKETAVDLDAKGAPMYEVLNQVIQVGCKAAIQVASRI
ncbi:ubiquinone biosynthesis protein COQ7 [Globomyces pollinis-pini]|nr:ubiquinone biosynthesis protein COQ7 [Globomyces pollinis-pini]